MKLNKKGVGSVAGLIFILTLGLGGLASQGALFATGASGTNLVPSVFTTVSTGAVVMAVLGSEKFQREKYVKMYGVEPEGLSKEEILVAIADDKQIVHGYNQGNFVGGYMY